MVAWFLICVHYHGRLLLPLNKYRNKKSGHDLTADNVVRWNFSIPFNFIVTGFFSKLIKFFVSVAINVLSSNNHLFYDKKKSFTKQLIRTFSTTIEHMCRNACIIQSIVGNVVIILRQHIVFWVVVTKSIELQLLFGIQCWHRMKLGLPFDHR